MENDHSRNLGYPKRMSVLSSTPGRDAHVRNATTTSPTASEDAVRGRLLDVAEALFYEQGIQAVGMQTVRDSSGVSLKRIYALYPSKEQLAVAMLDRRDDTWHGELAAALGEIEDPRERVVGAFSWLARWLAGPGHRGCAWINAHGELGAASPEIDAAVRRHKARFRGVLDDLVRQAELAPSTAEALYLLAEGAMVTTRITGRPSAGVSAEEWVRRIVAEG